MRVTEIKKELKQLIELENDPEILDAIRTLLSKSVKELMLKEKLIARAKRSNKDIKEGKLLSRDDVETKRDSYL
ncbi:MAG: hypothetical protein EA412_14615 [Chitinophagaceae bacterium]|nr:MAG: hypothetical protein EA412_14615 [Chitinophagaceae bacterium]